MHRNIGELIENVFDVDQQLRKQKVWSLESINKFSDFTDFLLKEIVKRHGVPTPSVVGQKIADKFVILLCHCTDLKFIQSVADSPKFIHGKFRKDGVAVVLDNLLVRDGKKQRFGTILKKTPGGNSAPTPIEDEINVDKRRGEFGLETTLEEYIKNTDNLFKKIGR